ncbi:hypothetical protein [Candidatus Poriferisodalis sp.]|uniref:hypothetical protein n=1 Tax=Candidatus Poriferisodalis sp. TaxID=3101277 RepID=UPI003B529981
MNEATLWALLVRECARTSGLDGLADIRLDRLPQRSDIHGGSLLNESGKFIRLLPAGVEAWCEHDKPGRTTSTLVEELRNLFPSDPSFEIWALCMEMGQAVRNSLVHSMPAYDDSTGELTGCKSPSKGGGILEVPVDENKYAATQVLLFTCVGIPLLTLVRIKRDRTDIQRAWSDAADVMLKTQSSLIERHMMPHFQYLPKLSQQLATAFVQMRDAISSTNP